MVRNAIYMMTEKIRLLLWGGLSVSSFIATLWTPYAVVFFVVSALNVVRIAYPIWRQGLP